MKDGKKNVVVGVVGGKGSIVVIGLLWVVCDDLMVFCKWGFGGNLVYKVD